MNKHFAFIPFFVLLFFCQGAAAQNNAYARVQLLLESSRVEEAMLLLDSLAETMNERSSVFQYYKATACLSLQRYEASLQICKEQIPLLGKKDTLLHHMYFISSLSHDQLGNREEALRHLEKAIKLKPDEISYYLNASFYYGESADYKNCLSNLVKAIALEPKNVYVLNNLSYYNSMNQQYSKAMDYANKGLKLASDVATKDTIAKAFLLNNRGFAQMGMRNFEAAMKDIEEALKLNPENAYAYYNKALLYILLGEEEYVCENLEMAVLYGYIYSLDELKGRHCGD